MTLSRRNFLRRLANRIALPTAALLIGATTTQFLSAQAYCPKQNRECLLFIANLSSPNQSYAQQRFYQFVEHGAKQLALATLGHRYNRIWVCERQNATRANLTSRLRLIANQSHVQAVDLIFVTHGLSQAVVFADQEVTMSQVRWDIRNGISSSRRQKLRMVFSTACYGGSHRYYWRNAGFECVSGGRRIYADSGTSYIAFLSSWSGNATFQTAVTMANASDPLKIQDNAAKGLLQSWGYPTWWDVNSYRDVSGRGHLRITHRPY